MNLELLKNYLNSVLSEEYEKLLSLNDMLKIYEDLENIARNFEEGINAENIQSLDKVLNFLDNQQQNSQTVDEIKYIYEYWDIISEERKKELNEYFKLLATKLKEYQKKYESQLKEKRDKILTNISVYEEYNSLISEDFKVIKSIAAPDFPMFLEFLKKLPFEKTIIQELILEFYDYNIQTYLKEKENKKKLITTKVKINAAVVADEIIAAEKTDEELLTLEDYAKRLEIIKGQVAADEVNIIDKIEVIYQDVKQDATTNNEIFANLLIGNYSVENHEEAWYLESDIKKAFYTDLIFYLIPNFSSHPTEILNIFKRMIELYDSIQLNEKTSDIQVIELSEEDENIIRAVDEYISAFNFDLDEKDIQILEAMYNLLLQDQVEYASKLSNKFTVIDARKYVLSKKLKSILDDILEVLNNQTIYINDGNISDIQILFREDIDRLKYTFSQLKQIAVEVKTPEVNITDNPKNIVIFPYNGITIRKSIRDLSNNGCQNILATTASALNILTYMDAEGIKNRSHSFKTSDNIPGYRDIAKPRSIYGSKNIRVGYITVEVTPNNNKIIQERYGLPKNSRIYLAFSLFYKTDSHMVTELNSDFAKNIEEIKMILYDIFGRDFTAETYKKALDIIDNSESLISAIKNNDTSLLESGGR